ncbi:MAG: class I SAM-dependent RNA methyltransferase [Chthoniobacterales bacterium]
MDVILEITDVGFGGKAVARLEDGRVCFVRDALPGERVKARVHRQTTRFVEAELVEILETSPRRVVPPCPYYGTCGGCSYQHTAYDYQLELKTKQVRDTLRRLGGIENPNVTEGMPSPLAYGYRNRITVHRRDGRIGFHRRDGRGLVDIEACLLASDAVNKLLTQLRHEPVREGARTLREHNDRFGFHQTNDVVAGLLLDAVAAACGEGGELLVDAYCGDGFFARKLAPKFRRAIGIEWNERSIAQAREIAAPNESYLEGDVSALLDEALVGGPATVILDPPAQGVEPRVIDSLSGAAVEKLIYVSCDPSTLARDLKMLAGSYVLESATPFDMFPQTAEIEVLAILRPRA